MYPPKFEYYRASSIDDALSLMRKYSGAKVLAGGHSLIPAMKMHLSDPGVLIDIGRIAALKGISSGNGFITIGALTTHAMVAASDLLPQVLSEAAGKIGDPQVRNRGTIGGNISHADPGSDLPTVLTALGAKIHVASANEKRIIDASDFFLGVVETALRGGEIVTAIEVPSPMPGSGSAYAKLENPASRYAMVGVAAAVRIQNGKCTAASVAFGGLVPAARKSPAAEAMLVGKTMDPGVIAAAAEAVQKDLGDNILNDMHAGVDYRKSMVTVFAKRALSAAVERAITG